jgi:hypothetical protein
MSEFFSLKAMLKQSLPEGSQDNTQEKLRSVANTALATGFAATTAKKMALMVAATALGVASATAPSLNGSAQDNVGFSSAIPAGASFSMLTGTSGDQSLDAQVKSIRDAAALYAKTNLDDPGNEVSWEDAQKLKELLVMPDFAQQHFKEVAKKHTKSLGSDVTVEIFAKEFKSIETPVFAMSDVGFCAIGMSLSEKAALMMNTHILPDDPAQAKNMVELIVLHEVGHCVFSQQNQTGQKYSTQQKELFADMYMVAVAQSQSHLKDGAALSHFLKFRAALANEAPSHDTAKELGAFMKFSSNGMYSQFGKTSDSVKLLFQHFGQLTSGDKALKVSDAGHGAPAANAPVLSSLTASALMGTKTGFGQSYSFDSMLGELKQAPKVDAQAFQKVLASGVFEHDHDHGHSHGGHSHKSPSGSLAKKLAGASMSL